MEDLSTHLEKPVDRKNKPIQFIDSSVIRLGGDSGDGMQLVGDLFSNTCAINGDYFATLPDYPSEIRAPAGTVFGVSGFQICIGGNEVYTPGDSFDTLVAMNPAALKVNLPQMRKGGVVIVNEDTFIPKLIEKAGYAANPLEQAELWSHLTLLRVPMSSQSLAALSHLGLSNKEADRCKNFFALGVLLWLYSRSPDYSRKWMEKKFGAKPDILTANKIVFEKGLAFGETLTQLPSRFDLRKPDVKPTPGLYRSVTGNQAAAFGLMAASQLSGLRLFLGSYPITPATDIMHELTKHPEFVTVFQAEDEIAAIGASIGASFGGALAATNTSGPGFSLKSEFMNLAVITELPLVIIDVQRAGPSTGIPTKTEQSDLMQALWGRHGESPIVVLACSSPKDAFETAIEASRLAIKYMTPVIVLSDGYIGNGSEVWKVPDINTLTKFPAHFRTDPKDFKPYERDEKTLARPWAIPGTPGLEHRLGGLEKTDVLGTVSQDPLNHEKMTYLRAEKVARVSQDIPPTEVYGHPEAELLVLGWGGTAGVIKHCVRKLSQQGVKVASAHLRHLNPLPPDLGELLKKYKKVLIPELNTGQLWYRIRAEYLINTERLNKIQGQPFRIDEVEAKILSLIEGGK